MSGWLTDRFDPRKLLGVYYGVRGLSLIYLPYSGFSATSLTIFAVLYGLDWIATVPPTLRLSQRSLRRPQRAARVRLDRRRPSGRRGDGGLLRRRHARAAGRLCSSPSMIAGMTAIIAAALSLLIDKDHPENALRSAAAGLTAPGGPAAGQAAHCRSGGLRRLCLLMPSTLDATFVAMVGGEVHETVAGRRGVFAGRFRGVRL